ncbi:MAG: ComF family protein [Anaerolineaceae bacterium]|nr:ComF family protein [Anaerolineaceae bacterium]MDD4042015.1 ComF family protein [Anaerolineaceae bacterium]MDD4577563.1 ComF family protein [Anaerolineaceae bacterium]
MKNFTLSIARTALDWLFPPTCLGCGEEGVFICPECFSKIKLVPRDVCNYCGAYTSKKGKCANCHDRQLPYAGFRAFAFYEGVIRKAIHHLKYQNDLTIGRYLAGLLTMVYQRTNWEADLVVPIPIGEQKRYERGYNQAERLAKPLAELLEIPFTSEALIRINEISSQVGLNHEERRENVREAFVANARLLEGKKVLLVDDVFTSGATMEAAASEVMAAGATRVFCLTVAKVNNLVDLN